MSRIGLRAKDTVPQVKHLSHKCEDLNSSPQNLHKSGHGKQATASLSCERQGTEIGEFSEASRLAALPHCIVTKYQEKVEE